MKKFTKEGFEKYVASKGYGHEFERVSAIVKLAEEYAATLKDKPMSVDEIIPHLLVGYGNSFRGRTPNEEELKVIRRFAEAIQPLTVQQGFVPDWDSAPPEAERFVVQYEWDTGEISYKVHILQKIPRPVTEKTDEELRASIIEALKVNVEPRESLLKICEILGRKVTK